MDCCRVHDEGRHAERTQAHLRSCFEEVDARAVIVAPSDERREEQRSGARALASAKRAPDRTVAPQVARGILRRGMVGLPVRNPREGGGGGGQPPPSKTGKPTTQTTCWRIDCCVGIPMGGAQEKPRQRAGLMVNMLAGLACVWRGSKPTTPTPSRAVGCALR